MIDKFIPSRDEQGIFETFFGFSLVHISHNVSNVIIVSYKYRTAYQYPAE